MRWTGGRCLVVWKAAIRAREDVMIKNLLLVLLGAFLLAGCTAPLAPEVRQELDPDLDYAMLQAEPQRYLGKSLQLGGSIVNLNTDERGTVLEILRWDLDRRGEPLVLAETGDRFLVRTPERLDDELYSRGRLVTLGGTLVGTVHLEGNHREESVLLFDLLGAHLWDTPFRYGLHPNPDPGAPEYLAPTGPGPNQPYDPTPWSYPYSPFWYRVR